MAESVSQLQDHEYDPTVEPESSKSWLNLIEDAEKKFEDYHRVADSIDDIYSKLADLSRTLGDRQFRLFWANVEVLKPSIYARPPVPVVVPKFKDRKPLLRTASELLERATVTAFDLAGIDTTMRAIRDDVAIVARGTAWIRYETKDESDYDSEKICVEHLDRRDFLHDPARTWYEVGWVARRGFKTQEEMKERFKQYSGDAYLEAVYNVQKKDNPLAAVDPREKCGVWEIWSKTHNKVVWVTEGVDVLLDSNEPHLKLEGFFPTPQPAYSTLQRRSLIPVPDMLFYRDQLEEINELTNRIHALSRAIQVKGFYPAGGEIGQAVESALQKVDDRQVMVPVANWAAFGTGGDVIVWLPIKEIGETIAGLVEIRRQVIEDVYQIMGLSDIMRGQTEASETATAQQIKAQYGSVRIRDKQSELVRVARDLVRISAEIMAENFSKETLLSMSQMELPTNAQIKQQVAQLTQQKQGIVQAVQNASQDPNMMQQAQQNPEAAQKKLQEAQQQVGQIDKQLQKVGQTVTIEQVMELLREDRIRPFVFDIETDSTIQPDEDAEKERRTEFMGVFFQAAQALGQMVQAEPAFAPLAGEALKFALAPFRVGRELEGVIDEFVDNMQAKAQQPQPNPEAQAAQAEMEMKKQDLQAKMQIEQMKVQAEQQGKEQDAELKREEHGMKLQEMQAQQQRDQQKHELEIQKLQMELQAKQAELQIKQESAQIDAAAKVQQAQIQASSAQQQADIKADSAAQQAMHAEESFKQKSELTAQQAAMKNGRD